MVEKMNDLKLSKAYFADRYGMRLLMYTLFALIVSDGLITEFLVTSGHALEVNPFLRAWADQGMVLAIKVVSALLILFLLYIKHPQKPKLIFIITLSFTIFYTGVVFWNLFVFFVT